MPQSSKTSQARRPSFFGSRALSYSSFLSLGIGVCLLSSLPEQAYANSLQQRQIIKRQAELRQAMNNFNAGIEFQKAGDFENAVNEFQAAYELMPVGPNTVEHIDSLEQWYVVALIERSRQMASVEGRWVEAQQFAELALSIRPQDPAAKLLVEQYGDPEYLGLGERAADEDFKADVAQVKELLLLAESQYRTAQYDAARDTYNRILLIDPYNSAARRGLERVARQIELYAQDSYNQTRAELLSQVTESWALPVPTEIERRSLIGGQGSADSFIGPNVRTRLEQIVLPNVSFEDTPLEDVITILRQQVRENLPLGENPINFVINIDESAGATAGGGGFDTGTAQPTTSSQDRFVNLVLSNVNMIDLLEFICQQTNTAYSFERGVVVIRGSQESTIVTETFDVLPNFLDVLLGTQGGGGGGGGGGGFDPFEPVAPAGGGGPRTAQEALKNSGVVFDAPGSFARLNEGLGRLQVAVTADQMPAVESIVSAVRNQGPKQVRISTRFIEVQENKEDEFGFDWLLGQFNLPGSNRVFGGGGTPTTGAGLPFVFPDSGEEGIPVGGSRLGQIRSSGQALTAGAIDALLSSGEAVTGGLGPTPGLFSLAGVFTDPQFQVVLRALNQSTGSDLMTAPNIVTQPGLEGKIEIIREFIYPGDYDPPEIPQNIGGGGNNNGGGNGFAQTNTFPVTPATPRDWQTEQLGVTLTVTPVVSRDNSTISMKLIPEVTEFQGFINYGTPIQTAAINAIGQPVNVVLTDNRILQPVFSKRTVETSAIIYDGSTLAIGGLIREDVQQFEDKLPILGDIPIIGRLFQSRGESHLKRNLVIFVTGEIIGPDGRPLRITSMPEEPAPVQIIPGAGSLDSGLPDLLGLENK